MVDVVRDVKIPWDPDSEEITIRTDSVAGSDAEMAVWFYNDASQHVGGVRVYFTSPIKYRLVHCTNGWIQFPVSLPPETDKTWKISYSPAEKRVVYYCNEVEVLNLVLSDSVCDRTDIDWKETWEQGEPIQINFPTAHDTASDEYSIMAKIGMYLGKSYLNVG